MSTTPSSSEPSNNPTDVPEPTEKTNKTPGSLSMSAVQVGILVVASVILNSFVGAFSGLKGSYLLKDALHLSASQVSTFGIIVGLPAYLRPFMGTGADLFPLFGFHRRSYYTLSWILYGVGLLSIAAIPSHSYGYFEVAALSIVVGTGANLAFVIMDAVMVSIGNRTGMIGRLQSLQQGIPLVLGLYITSTLSGYVAQHWTYSQCYLAGGLCAICGALLTFLILEKPVDRRDEHPERTLHEVHIEKQQDRRDMKAHAATLGKTVVSPALWVCVFYVFYLIITPGTLTAQFYYATSVLHFSPQFIGNLGMPYAAGAIVGTVLFLLVSKRLATAVIVWGAFFGDLSAYPLLFALHSHTSATIITFVGGITGQIYNLCLLTFAAKVCPKGIEASIYALFIAAVTLAGTLGDKIGSSIYDYYGPAHHLSITNGWHMLVWAGIVLTALSAVIIPFLPRWTISPKAERLRNQVA